MTKKIIITLALLCPAFGTYSRAAFQDPGWSARAEGMGGVFCASGGDASSIFYNPAAIRSLSAPEFVLMGYKPYMSLSGVEWKYYQFSAVYPKDSFTMGMAYSGFNAQSLYFENSLLFSGAFSRGAADIGGSLKYLSHSYSLPHEMQPFFDSKSASGFSADIGAVFRLNGAFAAGMAAENIIPVDMGIKYDDPVPSIYRMGFSAKKPELGVFQNVLAGMDIVYRDQNWGDKLSWGIGAEAWFANESLAIRGGYSVTEINMGASFVAEHGRYGLDYSFSLPLEISDNSGSHRIQMVFHFSRSEEQMLRDDMEGIKVPVRRAQAVGEKDAATAELQKVPSAESTMSEVYPDEIEAAVVAEPEIEKPVTAAEPEKEKPAPVEAPAPRPAETAPAPAAIPESDMDSEIRRMEEAILGEPKEMTPAEKARAGEHFNKATALFKQGRYEDAIAEWQKVLIINPGHELSKEKIRKAQDLLDGE